MTSIRRQLTRKLLAAVAIPVIAGSTVAFFLMRDEAIEQFDDALSAKAAAIAGLMRVGAEGRLELDPLTPALQEFAAPTSADARTDDESEGQALFQIRKFDGRLERTMLARCRFVPLVGGH